VKARATVECGLVSIRDRLSKESVAETSSSRTTSRALRRAANLYAIFRKVSERHQWAPLGIIGFACEKPINLRLGFRLSLIESANYGRLFNGGRSIYGPPLRKLARPDVLGLAHVNYVKGCNPWALSLTGRKRQEAVTVRPNPAVQFQSVRFSAGMRKTPTSSFAIERDERARGPIAPSVSIYLMAFEEVGHGASKRTAHPSLARRRPLCGLAGTCGEGSRPGRGRHVAHGARWMVEAR
jgi:hypothetical protein